MARSTASHHHPASVATIDRPDWLDEDVWPYQVRTYVHGATPLHYLDEGDGSVVVLVHAGTWSFVWRDLVRELRPHVRCLALDFPGAGLSGGGRDDVDLARYAEALDDWLDHLGIDEATFVVHDLGGVVGVTAAAARPRRVTRLVAVNSFAWPAGPRALRVMLGAMGSPTATALLGTFRVVPRLTRTSFGVGQHLDRTDRRAFFGPFRSRERSRNFHRTMASARRSPDLFAAADEALRTTLRRLPVLTVFGERNDPFGFGDEWRERFPHADSHVVEGGNHFPMCDDPEQVGRWILDWLDADDQVTTPSVRVTPGV